MKSNYVYGSIIAVGASLILHVGALAGLIELAQKNSPRIESETQLEGMLKTERKRLHIPDRTQINAQIYETAPYSYAKKTSSDSYEIALAKNVNSTLATLRHELYHIADGQIDSTPKNKFVKFMKYLFWDEPRAVLYSLTSGGKQ